MVTKLDSLNYAIKNATIAIERQPDNPVHYVNRGWALVSKQLYTEAIADFDNAIALAPDYALAYNNRGVAHHGMGDYLAALADYGKAIELSPVLMFYRNRAKTFRALNRLSEAESDEHKAQRTH